MVPLFLMSFFIMRLRLYWAAGALSLLLAAAHSALAQQASSNDGFLRRNGQMQIIRNGQARPMTRDARLPTGATITKDGFVVAPDGQRTELREGQGCDLRGRLVAVRATATGALALAAPAGPARTATHEQVPARAELAELFGSEDDDGRRFFKVKKAKKHHGKGHGRWTFDD